MHLKTIFEGNIMDVKNVRFTSTKTWGFNKVGLLRRDKDGYVKVVIGAMNMFNSANMYYEYEASKAIFEESSQLMRRVQNKRLRGELGHPRREPGMTDNEFRARLLDIYEPNTICHYRSIELDFNNYKDPEGRPVVAILAEVCPSGPHAPVFERMLANKDENLCFSIRSFTHDWIEGGIVKRKIIRVSTFDLVNEPGISIATKEFAPSLESLDDKAMSRGDMVVLEKQLAKTMNVGNESFIITDLDEARKLMGWNNPTNDRKQSPWKGW